MNNAKARIKTEDGLSLLAVLFLLFSAMLDPELVMILAVALFILLALQQLFLSRGVR